jgi:tetratricopeptide (TPR) repeat protein
MTAIPERSSRVPLLDARFLGARMQPSPGTSGTVARAAMNFVGNIAEIDERNARFDAAITHAKRAVDMANYGSQAYVMLADQADKIGNDGDWKGAEAKYKQATEDIKAQFKDQISDPTTYQLWEAQFNRTAAVKGIDVRSAARKKAIDHGVASLDNTLFNYQQLLGRARSPEEAKIINDSAIDAIAGAVGTGLITETSGGERARKFITTGQENMAKTTFQDWISRNQNYAQAYVSLEKGQFGDPHLSAMWNSLDPEQRLKLKKEALEMANAQHALSSRAREDRERTLRTDAEATEKMILAESDPAKRDALLWKYYGNPMGTGERYGQLREWSESVGAGPVADDPATRETRRRAILNNQLTDPALLAQDLKDGKITFKTLGEFQKLIEVQQNQAFGRAKDILRNGLGVPEGMMITDISKNKQAQVLADAMVEFETTMAKSPDVNPVDTALGLVEKFKKQAQAGSEVEKSGALSGLMSLKYQSVETLMADLARGKVSKAEAASLIPQITSLRQAAGMPTEDISALGGQLK